MKLLIDFMDAVHPFPPTLKGRLYLIWDVAPDETFFFVSKLVGLEGRVIGIDMTDEQLDVARRLTRQ